jgi:hypothetical protein
MLVPLIVLVFGAIFVGFFFKDMFVGLGSGFFSNILIFDNVQAHFFFFV